LQAADAQVNPPVDSSTLWLSMLFTPEPLRRLRAEIAREAEAGKTTEAEAGAQLIERDPDFSGGYWMRFELRGSESGKCSASRKARASD
jgi:hypothetical protein